MLGFMAFGGSRGFGISSLELRELKPFVVEGSCPFGGRFGLPGRILGSPEMPKDGKPASSTSER